MKLEGVFDRFKGIGMREMAIFSRQFATLVASGMPMLRSLYTLEDQTEDERLAAAIGSLRKDVEAGSGLADAMERQPEVFDQLFRSMVRSGEGSGRLDEALERVAFQLEKMDALKRQIRSAMMYPAFVFGLAVVILLVIVSFIVPIFVGVFEEIASESPGESSELPFMTQITVGISDFIKGYWFIWFPGLILGIFGFRRWKKTERGRYTWDKVKLKIPAHIGDIVQKVALARWSRTFSGTVSTGVPILQSVKITGQTSGNALVEEAMDDVFASVKSGGTIASPIEQNPIFPAMVGPHGRRRRGDRPARAHAEQGRRLLRGRGGRQGEGADLAAGAGDDLLRRRHRRLHRDLDVPADLQPVRQDPVAREAATARSWCRPGRSGRCRPSGRSPGGR